MRFVGRAAAFVFLVLATVSCMEEEEGPCTGCASPHPYTSQSGGTTSSFTGSAEVAYEHGTVTHRCDGDGKCIWVGAHITVNATVPNEWTGGDAGGDAEGGADASADAEAEADAGADADADVDAPDAATGTPRGWDTTGPVVIVDLGKTPLHVSAELVDARVITCPNRHEALVLQNGGYACESATLRPARVEALRGEIRIVKSGGGESSSTATHVEGRTPSGRRVVFDQSVNVEPVRSYTSQNCY